MYLVIVYDVAQKRVSKVCNFLRIHLNWVQNSVFEGEITKSQLMEIREGLKQIIEQDRDSILLFSIQNKKWLEREIIGMEKNPTGNVI